MAGKKKNNDMAEGMEVSKTASIIMTIVFIILAVVFLFPIDSLSDSPTLIFCGFQTQFYKNSPTFLPKTLDKPVKKCGASRLLIKKALFTPA